MSLRDQLLKAGLVSSEQAKKAENDAKKKRHQGKKDRRQGAEQAAKKAERERQQKAELEAKRERDRTLNREREAVKRRRENAARIRQLIKEHRANDPQAEIPYNFKAGKVVRRVRVTEPQQRLLAMGQLGIVRNPHDEFDFPLLPREPAEKLAAIDPKLVLVLFELTTKLDDDEWGEWPED